MDTNSKIYLDYAATTPVDPRVVQAMLPFFTEKFGNPSSVHYFGQTAEAGLENARDKIAKIFNCRSDEIIFTACGTESDNLAIRGAAWMKYRLEGRKHLLISPVEHQAVLHTVEQLAKGFGFDLEYLPVDSFGKVDPDAVYSRLRDDTALVSVIFGNNEIGTINPVGEIGKICRERGVLFHTDAVQAAAHLEIDLQSTQIDLMAIGAHKFYGPKGVGALYVRKGTKLMAVQTGGSQEYGLRAGTQNVPYIAGMAEALGLANLERGSRAITMIPLRDKIITCVLSEVSSARLTGHPTDRLPNHASFVFQGVDGNLLLMALNEAGFACSSGSACKTGDPEPSGVLISMGLDREWALGSLRVTLGKDTTQDEVESFLTSLPEIVRRLRALN